MTNFGRQQADDGDDGLLSPPFEVHEPAQWRAPVIFNSPHSGSHYPQAFLRQTRLDLATLQRAEDSFVDAFVIGLVARGFGVMRAHFPRSYIDVNREPYELDPRMYAGSLPSYANTRSMRVAGGLGTIPRVAGDAQDIYRHRLSPHDALMRIEALYKPYHRELRRLIGRVHQRFGVAILIDCHSMPSVGASREEPKRPDLVIGDRYGVSCAPALTQAIEACFVGRGYSVTRNKPYAGGFIAEHYGKPDQGVHAVQLELNRGLYINETTRARLPRFAAIADDYAALAEALAALRLDPPGSFQAAAE